MKTRIVVSSVFALLLTGFGASALAEDSGFFISHNIGRTTADGIGIDESDTSYRISVGYDYNQYFAVAVGYDNFGTFSEPGGPAPTLVTLDHVTGYNVRVIGTLPINDDWSVFGQIGNQHWDTDIIAPLGTANVDDDDLLIGVGGKWHVVAGFSLVGGYDFFEANNVDVNTWYIGGVYSFH